MGRRPKPKNKTQNQLVEISEENRRLREVVAYLSEVVLTCIGKPTTTAAEQSGSEIQYKGRSDDGAGVR